MAEWDKKGEEEISEIESNVSTTTWGPRRAHDMVNAQKSIRIALSLSAVAAAAVPLEAKDGGSAMIWNKGGE